MPRSIFLMGFTNDPFMGRAPGILANLPVLDLTYEQIRAQGWGPLRNIRLPRNYVAVFPYIVKLRNNEGEFQVYSDGTAQYTNYGSGNVSAPFRIK